MDDTRAVIKPRPLRHPLYESQLGRDGTPRPGPTRRTPWQRTPHELHLCRHSSTSGPSPPWSRPPTTGPVVVLGGLFPLPLPSVRPSCRSDNPQSPIRVPTPPTTRLTFPSLTVYRRSTDQPIRPSPHLPSSYPLGSTPSKLPGRVSPRCGPGNRTAGLRRSQFSSLS